MEQIYKLKMSKDIVYDFDRIKKYMSEHMANQFIKELNMKFKILKQMPKLYQRLYYEKKTCTDYRRIVHKKYIVIYKIHNNQITILRIVSERENYLRSRFVKSL